MRLALQHVEAQADDERADDDRAERQGGRDRQVDAAGEEHERGRDSQERELGVEGAADVREVRAVEEELAREREPDEQADEDDGERQLAQRQTQPARPAGLLG